MDWLDYYDTVAEEIDDDILDEADDLFDIGIEAGQTLEIPDEYFIWCGKTYHERVSGC